MLFIWHFQAFQKSRRKEDLLYFQTILLMTVVPVLAEDFECNWISSFH